MRIQDLPFLHFMVRLGSGGQRRLVAPMEVEDAHSGGRFVAPLAADGHFFPVYRFHFSVYLGNGEFVKHHQQKALFDGLAVAAVIERKEHLLLTFELPGPEPWSSSDFWRRLPRILRHDEEFFLPYLRRVPHRRLGWYGGHFRHRDFQFPLAELEPTEPKVLDEILDRFFISLIGCDPHTKYERSSG